MKKILLIILFSVPLINCFAGGANINLSYNPQNVFTQVSPNSTTTGTYTITSLNTRGSSITDYMTITGVITTLGVSSSVLEISNRIYTFLYPANSPVTSNINYTLSLNSYTGPNTISGYFLIDGDQGVYNTYPNNKLYFDFVVSPPISITGLSVSPTTCAGTNATVALTVTGTSPYTYAWSNGSTASSLSTSVAGIYAVTVTGANGTKDTKSEIDINFISQTALNQVLPSVVTICSGLSVPISLTALGSNLSYAWSNGSTGSSVTLSTTGTYIATITGTCGKFVTSSVQVNVVPITALDQILPPIATICSGLSLPITLSAVGSNINYAWSNGISGPSVTLSASGTYIATITGACGKFVTSPVQVSVINCTSDLSLSKISSVKVFPNPSYGSFEISAAGAFTAEIYNALGLLIGKTSGDSGSVQVAIPNKGVYILKISSSEGLETKKIVVE